MQRKPIKRQTRISVIIVTRNRHRQLIDCLQTLHSSTSKYFDLIVIDQSDKTEETEDLQSQLAQFPSAVYVKSGQRGKSKGLNIAIQSSRAPILAFTDDDCLVDKHWLSSLSEVFYEHPDVVGVFGRTLPFKPAFHMGRVCPAFFDKSGSHNIVDPQKDLGYIGYGNNMAFRKSVFKSLGAFRWWLGPGSIGSNGEDVELAIRCLIHNQALRYESRALVYHNRWITPLEYRIQDLSYVCGEAACYGYYALLGYEFAKYLYIYTFRLEIKHIILLVRHLRVRVLREVASLFFWFCVKLFARLRGTLVAIYGVTVDTKNTFFVEA
ncbi:hypothetical protein A2Z00_05300 [Candidatus Gottesmanbacteria bacterium RBG_13_45_10]|uniref:Glycosyltransferase 2-like domain-containing protein n=1 Tax=Candidatus Gottesmanbacteria bacterium RBG_13_45_10 TaxID=1798370 RepID=A0A1F5ZHF5_9BACT|nr:MAG: hypothetical protein A2Z00_05300 [Candidatus Gottesmanbacteria bacterium RBG_13_45_10]